MLPDARVQLQVGSEGEPTRDWAIAVTGGIPSVDVVTVPDPVDGYALFAGILGESATVELTATLPAGSQLTEATCFSYDEQVDTTRWSLCDSLFSRSSLGATTSAPMAAMRQAQTDLPLRSSRARSVDAPDGNLATVDDQSSGQGWKFDRTNSGAINEAFPVTNSDGLARPGDLRRPRRDVSHRDRGTPDGFELLDASCMKIGDSGDDVDVGEFDGSGISLVVDGSEFASYQCTFINARSPENGVGGQTLPPTDAVGPDRARIRDSWRVMVFVLALMAAAIGASLLIVGRAWLRR